MILGVSRQDDPYVLIDLLPGARAGLFLWATHVSVELAEELRALAVRVRRLAPSNRDPERYHIDKDAAVRDLLRLAARLAPPRKRGEAPRAMTETRLTINGRTVTVQHRRAAFAISSRSE